MGRDARLWPMLALLLGVVVFGIGCVLWFMSEAMRNERVAVRERLADAYRGQLALVQQQVEEKWRRWRAQLDHPQPDAAHFARVVQGGLADAVICFDEAGRVTYPRLVSRPSPAQVSASEPLQQELRARMKASDPEGAIQFVLETFATEHGTTVDTHGRLVAPNAELLALEILANDKSDPRFETIASRLRARISHYESPGFPASQRVFVMREMQRLAPGTTFPTLAAEELAARFLDAHLAPAPNDQLRETELPDVWSVATPSRRVVALLSAPAVHSRLAEMTSAPSLPLGGNVALVPPGEDAIADGTIATAALSPQLPGWRLALSLDDRAKFDEANDRVSRYLLIGTIVVAAMLMLAILTGRKLGRQMQLARLKNDLVANVSHELKTPLTSMRALVDTLLDAGQFDEQQTREYLQLMAVENARLSRLIDNFLTFSRLERNKYKFSFAPLRPAKVVEDAIAALGSRAQAPGCTLSARVAPDLPEVEGDSDALVTALLNLCDNAWKYTGDVKEIRVAAEAVNGTVHFAVQDNGAGLSRAESRSIFDRFHQADNRLTRAASGCGLGLSIVRSIVAAHHGEVQVASEPGRGSTFTMIIPAIARRTSA